MSKTNNKQQLGPNSIDMEKFQKKLQQEIKDFRERDKRLTREIESLKLSESGYREVIEKAQISILRLDNEGRIIYLNEFAENLFEFSREELVGKNLLGTIVPVKDSSGKSLKQMVQQFLKGDGQYYSGVNENETTTKSGKRLWMEWKNTPVFDQDKNFIGIISLGSDITARKQMEISLKRSEEKYRSLFENLDSGFALHQIVLDNNKQPVDYIFLDINKAFEKQTGLIKEEILGRRVTEVLPGIEKDPANWIQKYGEVAINGSELIFENYAEPLEKWYSVVAYSPARNNFATIITDITQRKRAEQAIAESEEKFRDLFENSIDSICILDRQGRFLEVNPAFEKLVGYKKSELLQMKVKQLIHPEDKEKSEQTFKKLFKHGSYTNYQGRILNKSGNVCYIEVNSTAIKKDNEIIGSRDIIRDISQRILAENERGKLEEQLQQAQKMEAIGTLAGGIAHDFNNILGVIMGYTELTLDELPAEGPLAANLNQVVKSADRAKDMINQILMFSRKTEDTKRPVNLAKVVERTITFLRSTIPATIEIISVLENKPGLINANTTQLNQVIMNLCTNAAHAMGENGGILKIELKQVPVGLAEAEVSELVPGRYQQLIISDTGHGMTQEIIKRIFEPYFTTKALGAGTGMGLAIVHGVVKGHGGKVSVSSEPGQGTRFTILFPMITENLLVVETEQSRSTVLQGTEKILLVDDDLNLARMGKQMLENIGYKVDIRTSSFEAFEYFKIKRDSFDLVITDMTMPNMTGLQLAAEIQKIKPGFPIILCTGFSTQINEENYKDRGISGFVMKPMVKKEISRIIREVLDEEK